MARSATTNAINAGAPATTALLPPAFVVAVVGPIVLCGAVFDGETFVIVLFAVALPAADDTPGTEMGPKPGGGVPVETGMLSEVRGKVAMTDVVVAPSCTISAQIAAALAPVPAKEHAASAPKLSSPEMATVSTIACEPSTSVMVKAIVVVLSTSTPSRMYVVPSAPVPITSPLRLFVSSKPATKSCVVVCAKTP